MICRTGQICIVQSPTMNFIFSQFSNLNYTVFVSLAHICMYVWTCMRACVRSERTCVRECARVRVRVCVCVCMCVLLWARVWILAGAGAPARIVSVRVRMCACARVCA